MGLFVVSWYYLPIHLSGWVWVLNINLYVLSVRKELIEYYERRGFNRTGVVDDYPITAEVGIPLIPVSLVERTKKIR